MERRVLTEIVIEQNQLIRSKDTGVPRSRFLEIKKYFPLPHAVVISGLRRSGKSTLLSQIIHSYEKKPVYYFNFEDERLFGMSPDDLNGLYEIFLQLYGEGGVFFFDEIQNIEGWEVFVRRMHDKGFKLFITGSNASLLSREIGSRLTGRYLPVELYPFSFKEFLLFKGATPEKSDFYLTKERARLKRFFDDYLKEGGLPEFLKYGDKDILKALYDDILYRDIIARYDIKEIKVLRDLSLYLLSHTGTPFSYNGLKKMFDVGSMNTIKNYIDYLENTYLLFTLAPFYFSLKKQIVAQKKVYAIDSGIINFVSFKFSEQRGRILENLVFVELKRRGEEVYFYKTQKDTEVDFLIKKGLKPAGLIQVTQHLENKETKDRETRALFTAMEELHLSEALILSEEGQGELREGSKTIQMMPIYQWLLT
jgi:predicted AAA+ superfamily ATPase